MTIESKMNGTALEIALHGRLDAASSEQLKTMLNDALPGADSLILDFADLDYVSSAGLRLLLSTHKTMNGKGGMKVINVNEIMREVLGVTGLADVLTIE